MRLFGLTIAALIICSALPALAAPCFENGEVITVRGTASEQNFASAAGGAQDLWILSIDQPICVTETLVGEVSQHTISRLQIVGMPPPANLPIELKGKLSTGNDTEFYAEPTLLQVISGRRLASANSSDQIHFNENTIGNPQLPNASMGVAAHAQTTNFPGDSAPPPGDDYWYICDTTPTAYRSPVFSPTYYPFVEACSVPWRQVPASGPLPPRPPEPAWARTMEPSAASAMWDNGLNEKAAEYQARNRLAKEQQQQAAAAAEAEKEAAKAQALPETRVADQSNPCAGTSGDTRTQCALGLVANKNYSAARKVYGDMASSGDDVAAYSIGETYEKGEGAQIDYVLAYKWYDIAVALNARVIQQLPPLPDPNGLATDESVKLTMHNMIVTAFQKHVISSRDQAAAHLNASQLAEAQNLSRQWQAVYTP